MAEETTVPDISLYSRVPPLDVPTAMALGQSILSAAPKSPPADLKKALTAVALQTKVLKGLWSEREAIGRSEDRRPYDQALDGAWGCAYDRLDALGRLPAERYPTAEEAARLRQSIFPDGLAFLKLPYEAEWAESQRRLELIASKGWEPDLHRLIGAEFVTEVKRCHKDYGEVLGITRPLKPAPLDVNLTDGLRQLGAALSRYSVKLIASYDDDATAEWKQAVLGALRPFDELRTAQARRASSDRPSPEPTPPAPAPQ